MGSGQRTAAAAAEGATKISPLSSSLARREVERLFQSSERLTAVQTALNKIIEDFKGNPGDDKGVDGSLLNVNPYLKALEKAPHLILSESNPTWFLKREDDDAEAASRRLLKYWSSRVEIFGPDVAYLPVLSGDALSPEALCCLRSGAFSILPNDASGRNVLCVDLTRRQAGLGDTDTTKKARMQFSFWILCRCLSNPKTQSEGIVLVWTLSANGSLDLPNGKPFYSLIAEAMPLKVHSRHITCCVPRGAKRMYLDQFLPGADRSCGAFEFPHVIPVALRHVEESFEDLCRELEKYGLEKQSLPATLGGTWDYQQYNDFIDKALSSSRTVPEAAAQVPRQDSRKRAAVSQSPPGPKGVASTSRQSTLDGGRPNSLASVSIASAQEGVEGLPTPAASTNKKRRLELAGDYDYTRDNSSPALLPKSRVVELLFQSSEELAAMQRALSQIIQDFGQNPGGTNEEVPSPDAYLCALDKSPHLIISESNPTWFLQCEDGHAVAAGRRLLKYWSSRAKIFGPDLAYRSVLNKDALQDLNRLDQIKFGDLTILPDDVKGHSVIFLDMGRLLVSQQQDDDVDLASQAARATFFVLSQTLLNPKTQEQGIVFLKLVSETTTLEDPNAENLCRLMKEALPLKVHQFHVVCSVTTGSKRFFQEHLVPVASHCPVPGLFPDAIVTMAESPAGLFGQLASLGFRKQGLPPSMGGTWDYQPFGDNRLLVVSQQKHTGSQSEGDGQKRSVGPSSVPTECATLAASVNTVVHQGKSVSESPYSRSFASAPEEEGWRTKESTFAKVDMSRGNVSLGSLQKLQAAVKTIPAECFNKGSTKEEQAAYIRKRNAVYSKRKYYKDKLRLESLTSTKVRLTAENSALEKDNRRLEKLHQMAQSAIRLYGAGVNLSLPLTTAYAGGHAGGASVDVAAFGSDPSSTGFPNYPVEGPARNSTTGPPSQAKLPPQQDPSQAGFSQDSIKKLQDARETVPAKCFDKGTTEEEKAAYVRKRNAIYSKRKYYKDKLRMEGLTSNKDTLTVENKALRDENRRLERLFQMAQSAVRVYETTGVGPGLPVPAVAQRGADGRGPRADNGVSLSVALGNALSNSAGFSRDHFVGVGACASGGGNPVHRAVVEQAAAPSTTGVLGRNTTAGTSESAAIPMEAATATARLSSSSPHKVWPNPSPVGGNAVGPPGTMLLPESLVPATDQQLLMAGRSAAETELLRGRTLLPGQSRAEGTMALMQEIQRERVTDLPLHQIQHQIQQLSGQPTSLMPELQLFHNRQYQQQQQQQQNQQQQQQHQRQRAAAAAQQPEQSGSIEQVHQLLHEARIRQELAAQMALELTATAPSTATTTEASSAGAEAKQHGACMYPPQSDVQPRPQQQPTQLSATVQAPAGLAPSRFGNPSFVRQEITRRTHEEGLLELLARERRARDAHQQSGQ